MLEDWVVRSKAGFGFGAYETGAALSGRLAPITVRAMNDRETRPTCFLHIGPPKTGSSSIQNFMARNRAELKRHAVLYPKLTSAKGTPSKRHGVLRRSDERFGPIAEANWRTLEASLAETGMNVVLSSEFFCDAFRQMEELDGFLDVFDRHGYRVRIVAYVRDQPDWLNSWYVENQKRLSGLQDFSDYAAAVATSGRVNPWRYLENIIDNPRLSLDLVRFEQAAQAGLEIDFARRVGVPADADLKTYRVRNPNAGAKTVYAAQKIMERAGPDLNRSSRFRTVFRHFRKAFERFNGPAQPFSAIDDETYAAISADYRDGNARLADRFFGTGWGDPVPARSRRKNVFDPNEATAAERREVEDAIESTLAVIDAPAS